MDKTFKYADLVNDLANCPPADSQEINSNIYRYIFEDENHENNFKPVLLIKPARVNHKMFDLDEMKCRGYALSVYDSLDNSRKAFVNMQKRNKNFGNNVGEYVAEIAVTSDDGLASAPSNSNTNRGHFDFFEFTETTLRNNIILVEKLRP